MVLVEPNREHGTRELLGAAAALTGNVLAVTVTEPDPEVLTGWGADEIVHLVGENVEEDVAGAVGSTGARAKTRGRSSRRRRRGVARSPLESPRNSMPA